MKTFLKTFANICIVLVSVIVLSALIAPVSAHASTITFNAFNAPFGYQGFACAQQPVLVASGLHVGQILTASNISGSDCPRLWPRSGSCINNASAGCSEDGHSNLVYPGDGGGFDNLNKVGFYNGQTLIQEVNLTQLQNGVAVPCGATSAYVYFKDTVGDGNDFFDNNGGYHVTFDANVTTTNANACCSTSDCTTNQTCNSGTCISSCTPNTSKQCVGNSVYNFNSCGVQGNLYQQCSANQICQNAQCVNIPATISIVAPTYADIWTAGNLSYIKWNSTGVNYVNISVRNNSTGITTPIAYSVPAITFGTVPPQGNYLWTVPANFTSGYYTMIVTDTSNSNTTASQIFQIVARCTPNTSKQCVGNSVYNFDSCGTQGSLVQTCTASQICTNGACTTVQQPIATCPSGTPNVALNKSTYATASYPGNPAFYAVDGNAATSWNSGGYGYQSLTINLGQNYSLSQYIIDCGGQHNGNSGTITFYNASGAWVTSQPYACMGGGSPEGVGFPGIISSVTGNLNPSTPISKIVVNAFGSSIDGDWINVAEFSACGVPACIANTTKACVGNSVYNFDSCGTQGTIYQQCTSGQVCQNAQCVNVACSTNTQCGSSGFVGSPFCQNNGVYRNYITYTCNNPGTASSTCTNSTTAQLQTACTGNQTCANGTCANVTCSTNSQCGTNSFTGSPFCQSGNVYQNYITYTCNNPGTAASTCTNSTTAQLQTACIGNQTCANGTCVAQNITCNLNIQCGVSGVTGSPFCQSGNVYQNYTTYTCNSPGTVNSYCSNTTAAQLQTNCAGTTCSNGTCVANNLSISATASPNPVNVNQPVIFSSTATGGTGNYNYYWYGACTGNSSTCSVAFPQAGTYTAYLFVSSGSQYQSVTAPVTVNQSCTPNATQRCYNGNVYWYDSCGNLGSLVQTCANGCVNGTCQNANLTVTATASPNPAQTNQSVTFTANATGGTGSYVYMWTGACAGSSQTCTTSFAQAGTYNANVMVTSGSQNMPASTSVVVNQSCTPNATQRCYNGNVYWYDSCGNLGSLVQTCANGCVNGTCQNANLTVTATASPNPAQPNQTVVFSANATGGTGNYAYTWTGACIGSGPTCTISFAQSGTYTANVSVTSGLQTQSGSASVSVNQTCTSHDHLGCVGTNSYWFNSCGVQEGLAQDCGFGTCAPQTGTCVLNSFSLSCVANPAQAYTNQNVAFNAYIVLPTNNTTMRNSAMASANPAYSYNWSGVSCSNGNNSSVCSTSFTSAGTQTANLSVTVGTVTKTQTCSTTIFQSNCGSNCAH